MVCLPLALFFLVRSPEACRSRRNSVSKRYIRLVLGAGKLSAIPKPRKPQTGPSGVGRVRKQFLTVGRQLCRKDSSTREVIHEANISAIQPQTEAQARISEAHADSEWRQGFVGAPEQRSQAFGADHLQEGIASKK